MLGKKYKTKKRITKRSFYKKIRTIAIYSFVIISLLFASFLYYLIINNHHYFTSHFYIDKVNQLFQKSNFVLKNIYLEGQKYLSDEQVLDSINIAVGDSIFKRSVTEIKANLEDNSWVRKAIVDRELPNDLYIGIIEREPIGIKQEDKKLGLFDDQGKIIYHDDLIPFANLPIVISEDIDIYINNLYPIITKNKELYNKITSIIRISERRWDIKFSDIIVKLPERNINKAWDKLIEMHKQYNLLDNDIISIDLRVANKIFIKKKK